MLEFDSIHKSIKGVFKNKKVFNVRNLIIGGVLATSILLYSYYTKTVDCDVEEPHAHYYTNQNSFDKYITGERENVWGWKHTDDYIPIDKEQEALINFQNKNNLFKISDNQDKIKEIVGSQNDYTEYRYKYRWLQLMPLTVGKTRMFIPLWHTGHSWTTNPERGGLTGETREVSKVYYGYKIARDENDKLSVVQSEMVDNFYDLPEDMVYIKSNFFKTVHLDNKTVEVDYEDGQEEEKPNYEKQKNYTDPEPLTETESPKML